MVDLNEQELDALIEAVEEGKVEFQEGSRPDVQSLDLTCQERIIHGQLPTLDAINGKIASRFATGLRGRTRLSVNVVSKSANLLRFSEFYKKMEPPATVCLVNLQKKRYRAALILENHLADILLSAAMGDRKAGNTSVEDKKARVFTRIEQVVLYRILSIFTEAMGEAWEQVISLKPEIEGFEPDLRLAVIESANETAVECEFELNGEINGSFVLGIPFVAVENVKKVLSSPSPPGTGTDDRFNEALERELMDVGVELRVILGNTELTLAELLSLENGSVLTLNTDEMEPLQMLVQGRPKMKVNPRKSRGNIAVSVDRGWKSLMEKSDG